MSGRASQEHETGNTASLKFTVSPFKHPYGAGQLLVQLFMQSTVSFVKRHSTYSGEESVHDLQNVLSAAKMLPA